MTSGGNDSFEVGDWLVEPELNRISRESRTANLRPQVMELLVYLARQNKRVVSAEELLEGLWAGKIVTDSTVYNCVAELRHALNDGEDARAYIENVPKKGYRLLAPVTPVDAPPEDPPVIPTSAKPARRTIMTIGAVVISAVVVFGLLLSTRQSSKQATFESPASLQLPLQLPHFADDPSSYTFPRLALSPDGRQIAYIGFDGSDVNLYLKRADEALARKVPKSEGAVSPFFSPDGKWVAFYANGNLWQVSANGGQPADFAAAPSFAYGASWGDNGNIVFGVGWGSVMHQVSIAGGKVEPITELAEDERSHRLPNMLPGSNAILFQVSPVGKLPEIWVKDLRSGQRKYLMEGSNPKFANGKLLYQQVHIGSSYSLWSVDFDLASLAAVGDPVLLISDTDNFAVSRSGSLIYSQNRPTLTTKLAIIDESGNENILGDDEQYSYPRFSPDSRSLAMKIESSNEQSDIWIFGLSGNRNRYRLTDDGGTSPLWSPDSKSITYGLSDRGLVRIATGSSTAPTFMEKYKGRIRPLQWTDDGLLYRQSGNIYFQATDGEPIPIEDDKSPLITAEISPNGRWVAYARMESFRPDVFINSFPVGGTPQKLSTNGGDVPKWSYDGSKLYFVSYNNILDVNVTYDDDTIAIGKPSVVREFSGRAAAGFDPYDYSSDGKRLAIVDTVYGELPPLIYITNWPQMLLTN